MRIGDNHYTTNPAYHHLWQWPLFGTWKLIFDQYTEDVFPSLIGDNTTELLACSIDVMRMVC